MPIRLYGRNIKNIATTNDIVTVYCCNYVKYSDLPNFRIEILIVLA